MCSPKQSYFLARILVYVSFIAVVNGDGECYFPGRGFAPNHRPCNMTAPVSLCCPLGWTCFDNRICVVTNPSFLAGDTPLGAAARGACTDPLWDDQACGFFCQDLPVNDTTGRIRSCGDGTWCCEPELEVGTCDCGPAADGTFSLPDGTAQTVIGIDGPARTNTNVIPLVSPSNTPPESFPMPLSTIEESVAVTSSHSASASLPTLSSATFPSRVSLSIADISSTIYVNSLISSHAEVTLFSTSNSATSTSIAAFPTTSANPSHGSPSHTVIITASVLCGLGAGIIGTVVLLFCVRRFRCHCCCARRKPSQLSDRSSQELHDYSVPESAPAAAAVASSNNSGIADYRSQFPPSRIAGAGTVRRDQNGNIAPDHDCGNDRRQRQPQLRYPPPDSPYRSPPPHSHNEAPILGPPPPLSNSSREWNFSPPPSYSSDPPALSSSRPRGRGHRARRR